MRIAEAARQLEMTPRMLRYRESLGLLPVLRHRDRRRRYRGSQPSGEQHRQFNENDLAAVALGLSIERRYDISPVALAFGVRVLADPRVRADVAEFGRRIGRIQSPPARALDFEQERARRLLRLDDGRPAGAHDLTRQPAG
jgi:MerR family transcriptional regulator, copper efflux regulator